MGKVESTTTTTTTTSTSTTTNHTIIIDPKGGPTFITCFISCIAVSWWEGWGGGRFFD